MTIKKIDNSIYIKRPVAKVFAFVCDSANTPLWQPEARSSHHTPPGPIRKGTQIEIKARGAGFTLRSTSIVNEFYLGEKIAFHLRTAGDLINARLIWETEPESFGTRFYVHADYQLKGLFRLTAPILAPIAKKTINRHLQNLKAVLETGL
jgi:hypothetical protein